jgi:hypothetical protein
MSLLDAIGSAGSIASSAMAGAASGSVAGVPGAVIGGAVGLASGLYSANQQKKANSLLPPQIDPNQAAMERYYSRMKTAYQTGTSQTGQVAGLQSTTQEALRNAFKFGGASTDIAGIKSIYLTGLAGLNQQGQQMEAAYADRQNQAVNDIAERQFGIQSANYQQQMLNATNAKAELGSNANALLTQLPKLGGIFGKPTAAATTPTVTTESTLSGDEAGTTAQYLPNPFATGNALSKSSFVGSFIKKPALNNAFGLKQASFAGGSNPFAIGNALSNSTL